MNHFNSSASAVFDNVNVIVTRTWSSKHSNECLTISIIDNQSMNEVQLYLPSGHDVRLIKSFLKSNGKTGAFEKIENFYDRFIHENKKVLEFYDKTYSRH